MLSLGSNNGKPTEEKLSHCGVDFCPYLNLTGMTEGGSGNSADDKPDKAQIDMLSGILLGFALLASVIMAILVDPLSRYK